MLKAILALSQAARTQRLALPPDHRATVSHLYREDSGLVLILQILPSERVLWPQLLSNGEQGAGVPN